MRAGDRVLTALLSVIVLGFLLGMRHATDPDHVVAVTTIVSQQKSLGRAARTGVLWGIGHTATIFLVGGAIIVLKVQLSAIPARVGLSLEFAVAVMLVVLGLLTLAGGERKVADSTARPLTVGFIHGLAGSAAVATLPQVALIPNPLWAVAYLAVFGVGTIAGMLLITVSIAAPSLVATHRFHGLNRTLRIASGVVSILFGLFLAHRIGFVDGLFTNTPTWTPQ
ncbi:MAG: high-affinity nickel-transporter [Gemmatimonadetes bacterium]|nr:high-affinity nickel-transporter [Gemmatimonadota bacterium]